VDAAAMIAWRLIDQVPTEHILTLVEAQVHAYTRRDRDGHQIRVHQHERRGYAHDRPTVQRTNSRQRLAAAGVGYLAPPGQTSKWSEDEINATLTATADALDHYPVIMAGDSPLLSIHMTSYSDPLTDAVGDGLRMAFMSVASSPSWQGRRLALTDDHDSSADVHHDATHGHLAPAHLTGRGAGAWHEAGHLLAGATFAPSTDPQTSDLQHARFLARHGVSRPEIAEAIGSRYAATDAAEAFAELTAMWHTPGYREQIPDPTRTKAATMYEQLRTWGTTPVTAAAALTEAGASPTTSLTGDRITITDPDLAARIAAAIDRP
jgi:hypothetical protein